MSLQWIRVYLGYLAWRVFARPDCARERVHVEDIDIYFQSCGSGEPIVLLHGGFAFAEFWAGQFRALSRQNRVVAPDSRGNGRSTLGTEPMTYRQLAKDTTGLIDRLNLGPVHLVGWSDGGCTCIALSLERPDLVQSVTLIGTPFNQDNYAPAAKLAMQKFLRPHSVAMRSLMLMRRFLTPEPGTGGAFLERMSRMWTELPDFTIEELGRIEAPTLVIACDRDEYLSRGEDPLAVFKETAEAIPNSRMEYVPHGTHGVHMQYAKKVNRLISEFIRRV